MQLLRLRQEQQQQLQEESEDNSGEKEVELEAFPGGIASVSNAVSVAESSEAIQSDLRDSTIPEHEISKVRKCSGVESVGENRAPFRFKNVASWKRRRVLPTMAMTTN